MTNQQLACAVGQIMACPETGYMFAVLIAIVIGLGILFAWAMTKRPR